MSQSLAVAPCHLSITDYGDNSVVRFVRVPSTSVTITTRKAATPSSSFTIKGKVSDQVTKVTYRVGKSGPVKTAKGTASWNFKARLKPGRNVVTVIVEGPGGSSAAKMVKITRK